MDGCGVRKAVILGAAALEARIKERMDRAPGRMVRFASVDVTRAMPFRSCVIPVKAAQVALVS